MRKLLNKILGKKEPCPKWSDKPGLEGWYVTFKRGTGMDVMFWGGEDDPCFEPVKNAHYFGPFRLPL